MERAGLESRDITNTIGSVKHELPCVRFRTSFEQLRRVRAAAVQKPLGSSIFDMVKRVWLSDDLRSQDLGCRSGNVYLIGEFAGSAIFDVLRR